MVYSAIGRKLVNFASGSKGNCSLLSLGGRNILIDCGISLRRLKTGLAQAGLTVEDVEAVIVTHLHTDHFCGFPSWFQRTKLRFLFPKQVAGRLTHTAGQGVMGSRIFSFAPNQEYALDGVWFRALPLSHDAPETVALILEDGSAKFVHATDLGMASSQLALECAGADLVFMEANHELSLLQQGPYPPRLKRRIAGPRGHLSNEEALRFLLELDALPLRVVLGHLSEVNNSPDAVRRRLEASGLIRACKEVLIAHQRRPTEICC